MYVLLTNTEVLQICGITGIEAFLLKGQLRWAGHARRMSDDRVPKQVFCGQLAAGARPQCGPVRHYKDSLKENMKKCEMQPSTLSICYDLLATGLPCANRHTDRLA